jgi:hypothetical protein
MNLFSSPRRASGSIGLNFRFAPLATTLVGHLPNMSLKFLARRV